MEKPQNAAARRRLGISAFPTLYVVDPSDTSVAVRWLGSASIAQLEKLFDAGTLAVNGGARGPALEALVAADRAYGAQDYPRACDGYRRVLALADPSWPGWSRAVESALFAFSQAESSEATLALADRVWPRLRGTASAAAVAGGALDAALSLDDKHPARAAALARWEPVCDSIVVDATLPLVGDDRSGLYFSLESVREAAGDTTGMRALQERHVAMLEREAARATRADARAVYDAHRLTLYLALGRPEAAVPMLQASQRDLPDDYNPSQRLATAYKAMKRWPDALAASDRALAKAYGPRQFLVLNTRADIQLGMADATAAVATLRDAFTRAERMPEGQRSQGTIAGLRKRLAGLGVTLPE
jgi:tetratricopeptide (TPR) repeat protein